jgi:long-chain acyl-CoA synthetase
VLPKRRGPEEPPLIVVEPRTLPALLAAAETAFGPLPAFASVEGDAIIPRFDYARFASAARRFASLLSSLGIGRGDRVMILCENRVEWAVAYFGVAEAGAVAVPVLVDFIPEQVANVANHAEIRVACASERTLAKLALLPPTIPRLMLETLDESGAVVVRGEERKRAEAATRAGAESSPALPGAAMSADDLACVIYTSGTSGHSKGVMLTHGNLVSNAIATRAVFPLRTDDRVLSVMPLAHTLESTMGLITPLLQGCCIHYLDKPPTAPVLAAALAAVKPTVMVIVPLIIEKLFRARVESRLRAHPLYRFAPTRRLAIRAAGRKLEAAFGGRLRFLGIGGAALARDVEEFLLAARFPYAIGYGLTETSPLVAAAIPGKTRLGSTGRVLDGLEVRIALPDAVPSASAAAGREGEIQVRGPSVMRGYYRDEARTAEVFTDDGWFRTGDLGVFDADGLLHIRGRLKAMILGPSGENIYPEEIESVLASTGFVEESLVYAAKDGALVALVVLNDKAKAMAEEAERLLARLRAAANARLTSFSRLARLVVQDEPFEKTATLKIKRYLYPRQGTES